MITDMTIQRTRLDYLRHHTATSGPLVVKRMDFCSKASRLPTIKQSAVLPTGTVHWLRLYDQPSWSHDLDPGCFPYFWTL